MAALLSFGAFGLERLARLWSRAAFMVALLAAARAAVASVGALARRCGAGVFSGIGLLAGPAAVALPRQDAEGAEVKRAAGPVGGVDRPSSGPLNGPVRP